MIHLSGDVWARWEKLHAELKAEGKWDLADLFLGHEPDGFRESKLRILYVGKATAGPLGSDDPGKKYFFCHGSAFWKFADRLNQLCSDSNEEPRNIAWSNICKIGVRFGNPELKLAERQRDLAVETLRREWLDLKPTLVVCVAEGYLEHFIYEALGVEQNNGDGFSTHASDSQNMFCYRPKMRGWPAFLWMKHPQGKLLDYLNDAEQIAYKLLHIDAGVSLEIRGNG